MDLVPEIPPSRTPRLPQSHNFNTSDVHKSERSLWVIHRVFLGDYPCHNINVPPVTGVLRTLLETLQIMHEFVNVPLAVRGRLPDELAVTKVYIVS